MLHSYAGLLQSEIWTNTVTVMCIIGTIAVIGIIAIAIYLSLAFRPKSEADLATEGAQPTEEVAKKKRKATRIIKITVAVLLVFVLAWGSLILYKYAINPDNLDGIWNPSKRSAIITDITLDEDEHTMDDFRSLIDDKSETVTYAITAKVDIDNFSIVIKFYNEPYSSGNSYDSPTAYTDKLRVTDASGETVVSVKANCEYTLTVNAQSFVIEDSETGTEIDYRSKLGSCVDFRFVVSSGTTTYFN